MISTQRIWNQNSPLKMLLETREDHIQQADYCLAQAKRSGREFNDDEAGFLAWLFDEGEMTALTQTIDLKEEREEAMKNRALSMQSRRSQADISNRTQGIVDDPNDGFSQPQSFRRMARLKAFPNNDEGAKNAYSCGMWLRAVNAIGQNTARDDKAERYLESIGWHPQMSQTEGTDTKGGFLVPQPMSSAIITIRENVGVARRLCDILPMSSKTEDVPKRTGGLTVYYPGEGKTITASDMDFGRVSLNAKKRAVANQISSELSDDALVNMTDRAIDEMGYALADKEDSEFVNGDGSGDYGGEVGVLESLGSAGVFTAPSGQSTWDTIVLASFSKLKAKVPGKFFRKDQMAYLCSSEFYYETMDRLSMAAGGNTGQMLREGGLFDIADLQWNGAPVFLTDKMPSTTAVSTVSCLYGNFVQAVMFGDRTGVRIGMSLDYAFLDDVTTMLATSRYDINCHELGDDTTAGGVVGLKTAAS